MTKSDPSQENWIRNNEGKDSKQLNVPVNLCLLIKNYIKPRAVDPDPGGENLRKKTEKMQGKWTNSLVYNLSNLFFGLFQYFIK